MLSGNHMGGKEHFSVEVQWQIPLLLPYKNSDFIQVSEAPWGAWAPYQAQGYSSLVRRANHSSFLLGHDELRYEHTVQFWPICCKERLLGVF